MTVVRRYKSGSVMVTALALVAVLLARVPSAHAQQGDAAAATPSAPDVEPVKPKHKPKPKPVKKVEKTDKTKAAQTPAPESTPPGSTPAAGGNATGGATLAAQAAAGAGTPTDVASALKGAGVGRCADAVDAAAAPSMIGVAQSNMISTWSDQKPVDKHVANVVIGQRYANNVAVPFGATAVIASPTPAGACDITMLQVVSSPLPCASLRATLGKGKRMADVAGLTLVQDGVNNTLLMPTSTNTCVLIDYKVSYAP